MKNLPNSSLLFAKVGRDETDVLHPGKASKINNYHNLIQRRLSHMEGMYVDEAALEARLEIEESTSGNSRKKSLTFQKIISIKVLENGNYFYLKGGN
jgi:hypothetical protein